MRTYKDLIMVKEIKKVLEQFATVTEDGIAYTPYMDYREHEGLNEFIRNAIKEELSTQDAIDKFIEDNLDNEHDMTSCISEIINDMVAFGTISEEEKEILEEYVFVDWTEYTNYIENTDITVNCNFITYNDWNTELETKEGINKYFKPILSQINKVLKCGSWYHNCMGALVPMSLKLIDTIKNNPKKKYKIQGTFFLYSPVYGGGACEDYNDIEITIKSEHIHYKPYGYTYNEICGIDENYYKTTIKEAVK
ncbi:MAG: hypothetical protein ACRCW1_00600 [Anaerotignaceae bacterium]